MSLLKQPDLPIILVSTSPRRKEILNLLQVPFQTINPDFQEESQNDLSAEEEAVFFAEKKAKSVQPLFKNHLLIGSDTLIACEEMKIGKPKDFSEAKKILTLLRNRWHKVLSAVFLINTQSGFTQSHLEMVKIKMKNYSNAEIENYILHDQPYDKAGSYALQGAGRDLIEKLEGDYLAAVGLPLRPIAEYLIQQQFQLSVDIDKIYEEKKWMNWRDY